MAEAAVAPEAPAGVTTEGLSSEAEKDPVLQAIIEGVGEPKKDEKAQETKKEVQISDDEPEDEADRKAKEKAEKEDSLREQGASEEEIEDELSDEDEGDSEEDQGDEEEKELEASDQEDEEEDDENYDDYIVEVVVDGDAMEVSLKDLKSNFSANKYIQKNIQSAVEERKQSEEIRSALFNTYETTYQKLSELSGMLNQLAEPDIDWEKLRAEDPQTFLIKKEEQRELSARQQAVAQEAAKVKQEQAKVQADAMAQLTQQEAHKLVEKLPELKNPKQGKILKERFVSAAAKYGYTPDEIGTVIDHRALLALNDAAKWQDHIKKREKMRTSGKKQGVKDIKLKPGKGSTPATTSKRLADKLRSKAIRTGHPDDVAATLIVKK
jgi:hypothetical protein